MRFPRLVFAIAAMTIGWGGSAAGTSDVYHAPADDGIAPGTTPVLPSPGPEWLNLFVERSTSGASANGTPCVDGDGDELCAWEVVVQAQPGVEFGAFLPTGDVEFVLTPTELRANRLSATAPALGLERLGYLGVTSTNPATGGDVTLVSGNVVTAGFSLEAVAPKTLATIPLPEPGPWLQWATALGGLAVLGRVRRRPRSGRTVAGRLALALLPAFLGHPHFGIVIPPEDYVWMICSDALTQADQSGDMTPQEIAQDCATARWMMGWNEGAAGLGSFTPYLDNRSHPQIRWTTVAGDAGGLDGHAQHHELQRRPGERGAVPSGPQRPALRRPRRLPGAMHAHLGGRQHRSLP